MFATSNKGITTRNKKLLVTKGISSNNTKLLVAIISDFLVARQESSADPLTKLQRPKIGWL